MQFQEMVFTCDACLRGDDGRLKICRVEKLWFSSSGYLLIEAICQGCGKVEKYATSSVELMADFEEGQSAVEHVAEPQELIM